MADDDVQYLFHSVKAVRGAEARSIAKWEADGWELVTQKPGTLRSEITFRKPKKASGLAQAWDRFRGLPAKMQLAAAGGVVLLVVAVPVIAGLQSGDGTPTPTAAKTTEAAGPSSQPATTSRSETSPASTGPSDEAQTLTVKNSPDLAKLLGLGDNCDGSIAAFAAKHADESIEFNGNFGALNAHGSDKTRFDILVGAGNYSETSQPGPAFQFNNVGIVDLHLQGTNIPETVGRGDNVHVVATVGEYNPTQCLFRLDPISTEMR
jgi:hypothetical protein